MEPKVLQVGELVLLQCGDEKMVAEVKIARDEGRFVVASFQGVFANFWQSIGLRWQEGAYREVLFKREVTIELATEADVASLARNEAQSGVEALLQTMMEAFVAPASPTMPDEAAQASAAADTTSSTTVEDRTVLFADAGGVDLSVAEPACDFCDSTAVRWRYPARDVPSIPGSKRAIEVGPWLACDACSELIEQGDCETLHERSLAMVEREAKNRCPTCGKPQSEEKSASALQAIAGLHHRFFQARTGPRVPWVRVQC